MKSCADPPILNVRQRDYSGLGNCFVSIPNLKNLPMKLRMSGMIAPSAPHPSDRRFGLASNL
jgi:hypothetical protein